MMKFSILYIISSLLLTANGAPPDRNSQKLGYKTELSYKLTLNQKHEHHSHKSLEEHSSEYHEHHSDCEDCHEGMWSSKSFSLELDTGNSDNKTSSNKRGQGTESRDSKDSQDKYSRPFESKPDESPTEIENFDNSEPNEDKEESNNTERTPSLPQDDVTEDILSILNQTTPSEPEDAVTIVPQITNHQDPQKNPSRKKRHAFGHGFSYGYTVYHQPGHFVPHNYDSRHVILVPLHTSHAYVPHTPSPIPWIPKTTQHGSSDENQGSSEDTDEHIDRTTKNPDVIPFETTQSPTDVNPTENSPDIFEEFDNTEYPQEVFNRTEAPNKGTEAPDTTDKLFINLFDIE